MIEAAKVNEAMELAIVESVDKLTGAISILELLEDKADNQRVTASELSGVRCIIESCATNLDESIST